MQDGTQAFQIRISHDAHHGIAYFLEPIFAKKQLPNIFIGDDRFQAGRAKQFVGAVGVLNEGKPVGALNHLVNRQGPDDGQPFEDGHVDGEHG